MTFELEEHFYGMVPENFNQYHIDFYKIFGFIKIKYIRNSYRWNSHFRNDRIVMTKFDYEYANENQCFDNFSAMQHFIRKFQKTYKAKRWNIKIEDEYVDFIKKSMKELINNVSVPVRDVRTDIMNLIDKYRDDHFNL
jgi:hypothetical protein